MCINRYGISTLHTSSKFMEKVTVLEQCLVSPPLGSVPEISIPLTFFDLQWLGVIHPMEQVIFYELDCSKVHFTDSILPTLKSSLSLALQQFFPLSGNLIWSAQSNKPELVYVHGDSITLTIAESYFDFKHLSSNDFRDVSKLRALMPRALQSISSTKVPALALQVTYFPNSGISIGITLSHVAVDGKTASQFVKYWAQVCKLGGDASPLHELLPVFDRSMIRDPNDREAYCLEQLQSYGISRECLNLPNPSLDPGDKVQATFVMAQPDIDKLKKWVSARNPEENIYSTFAVSAAYYWVCMIKALSGNYTREYFRFGVELRGILKPTLPQTYFGNCMERCFTTATAIDLIGDDSIAVAAELIRIGIQKSRYHSTAMYKELNIDLESERMTTIAGSPKLGTYQTDFGWGKPKKVEIVSIIDIGAASLSERADGEPGIEIGLALEKSDIMAFAFIFNETIKSIDA